MAIGNTVVYNMQADGSGLNGAGYVENVAYASQVDYSQQAVAQLSITDGASVDGSAVLTSATGGFTAEMEGNIVCISSGTNDIIGYYEITAYTDTNTVTLDRDCATGGDMASAVCKVGGAWNTDESSTYNFFGLSPGTFVSGSKLYIKSGSYTLTSNLIFQVSSSTTTPFEIEGYTTSFGDGPTGTDRPIIDCGSSYYVDLRTTYCGLSNVRITGSAMFTYQMEDNCYHYNCSFLNTNATSGYACYISSAGGTQFYGCEFSATGSNAYALWCASGFKMLRGCYIHDSVIGINISSSSDAIVGCVFDTCGAGVNTGAYGLDSIHNCTFYNCTSGVTITTGAVYSFVNNILHSNTTAFTQNSGFRYGVCDHNCWYNNGTDRSTANGIARVGPHDITSNPLLTDPSNGDFSLGSGSPAIGAGADVNLTGATA